MQDGGSLHRTHHIHEHGMPTGFAPSTSEPRRIQNAVEIGAGTSCVCSTVLYVGGRWAHMWGFRTCRCLILMKWKYLPPWMVR